MAPSLPYNVVRRGVNTVAAKVARHKPLPLVLTTRGDYRQPGEVVEAGFLTAITGKAEPAGSDAAAEKE